MAGSVFERNEGIKFMDKILTIEQAITQSENLKREVRKIVLAGGCFDILHVGHITFLEAAKAIGDVLFVFLEADERISKLKGKNRPINNQEDRAKILGALASVDAVIKLPADLTDRDYDDMVSKLKPDILAVTKGDQQRKHKERQAGLIGCRVVDVTEVIDDQSTSRLVKLLGKDL